MDVKVRKCIGELQLNQSPIAFLFSRIVDFDYHAINLLSLIFKQKLYAMKCLNKDVTKQEIIAEWLFIEQMEESRSNSVKSERLDVKDGIIQYKI